MRSVFLRQFFCYKISPQCLKFGKNKYIKKIKASNKTETNKRGDKQHTEVSCLLKAHLEVPNVDLLSCNRIIIIIEAAIM